jgi:uncharacterized protein (TIGR02145 family)
MSDSNLQHPARNVARWPLALTGLLWLLMIACVESPQAPERELFPPTVTTAPVTNVTDTSAQCGGNVTWDGGAAVSARGVCWSTTPMPTIADSKTTDGSDASGFISSITGLTFGTMYYVRAYATNSAGTGYGEVESFRTGVVTDVDGNVYRTVRIGNQVWMVENLRVTRYSDSTPIPHVTNSITWIDLSSGAYCSYANDSGNVTTYGRLYNWFAVTDSPSIAPEGWRVPTDEDWQTLVDYLGGSSVAGGKLKEAGTTHWDSPNTGATNESGFTALPGGHRSYHGIFNYLGFTAYFWSSTDSNSSYAWARLLNRYHSLVVRDYFNKPDGFSVRCVRDY